MCEATTGSRRRHHTHCLRYSVCSAAAVSGTRTQKRTHKLTAAWPRVTCFCCASVTEMDGTSMLIGGRRDGDSTLSSSCKRRVTYTHIGNTLLLRRNTAALASTLTPGGHVRAACTARRPTSGGEYNGGGCCRGARSGTTRQTTDDTNDAGWESAREGGCTRVTTSRQGCSYDYSEVVVH